VVEGWLIGIQSSHYHCDMYGSESASSRAM
jgi:hypothetical protein